MEQSVGVRVSLSAPFILTLRTFMKSILLIISLVMALFAEPSFQDVQSMIEHQQFKQAKLALTVITTNHPSSSKVYYSLAQANAGLGDLPAARDALDRAKALNPKLDFATASQLANLEQAITPQAHLVTPVESSNIWWIFVASTPIGIFGYLIYLIFRKPKPTPKPEQPSTKYSYTPTPRSTPPSSSSNSTTSTYVDPTPNHTEVHHHHHSDSGMGTAGTILTAGLTAAAVSSMMDHHQATPVVIHEYPEYTSRTSFTDEPTSTSWEDSKPSYTSTHSSDYEDSTSRSSSWSDSSSSSSSWSDSSSSSSSSSWD